jgi:hypothetical protein
MSCNSNFEQVKQVKQDLDGEESGSLLLVPSAVRGETAWIDGTGKWDSWKGNFKMSMLALLNLFDNVMDASLVTDEVSTHFEGRAKVHMPISIHEKAQACA